MIHVATLAICIYSMLYRFIVITHIATLAISIYSMLYRFIVMMHVATLAMYIMLCSSVDSLS